MSPRIAGATAARVLRQLSHDRRTVAMLLVVPVVLMALLRWLFDAQPGTFDRVGPALVGIFPLVVQITAEPVAGPSWRQPNCPASGWSCW